jgi:hypothetical protein
MKIYVDGQEYPSLEYDTKQTKTYIYTNDGIYCYKKELQKMEILQEIKEKEYKNYHFFIEISKINYTDTIYHIPYYHLFCEEETQKKSIGDGIFLVKVNYFDQVNYYFETDRTDDSLYDAIITFLSSN